MLTERICQKEGSPDEEYRSDVAAIYATRSELISSFPPHTLYDNATSIRACGLSLNLSCQQYGCTACSCSAIPSCVAS